MIGDMVSLTNLNSAILSQWEKKYEPRISPDRVSSGPTGFTGSVAMDFVPEHAPNDPIEVKCEH